MAKKKVRKKVSGAHSVKVPVPASAQIPAETPDAKSPVLQSKAAEPGNSTKQQNIGQVEEVRRDIRKILFIAGFLILLELGLWLLLPRTPLGQLL